MALDEPTARARSTAATAKVIGGIHRATDGTREVGAPLARPWIDTVHSDLPQPVEHLNTVRHHRLPSDDLGTRERLAVAAKRNPFRSGARRHRTGLAVVRAFLRTTAPTPLLLRRDAVPLGESREPRGILGGRKEDGAAGAVESADSRFVEARPLRSIRPVASG